MCRAIASLSFRFPVYNSLVNKEPQFQYRFSDVNVDFECDVVSANNQKLGNV